MGLFKKAASTAANAAMGRMSPPGAIGGAGRTGGVVGVKHEFAFVDVETSGLEPWRDRVIEIAIVITDGSGRKLEEWTTLVNPGTGDAGKTKIHLIDSSWLVAAPSFGDLAGDIANRLSGRVLVCHNAEFDRGFLEAEFDRAGVPIRHLPIPCFDTMTLANTLGMPRALQRACKEVGYVYDSHNAVDDAVACAELFHRLASMIDRSTFSNVQPTVIDVGRSPCNRTTARATAAAAVRPRPILAEFTQYLHAHDPYTEQDDASLRRSRDIVIAAIDDGYIDEHEQYAMSSSAHHLKLSLEDVQALHHEVILGMLDAALEDNRISKNERAEVERAATWLSVDVSDWDALIKAGRKRVKQRRADFSASVKGKVIVFTGQGVHPQNVREALALKHGVTPKKALSADADMVVIGSDDLDTATVQKARAANPPLMVERTFWQRLGEL